MEKPIFFSALAILEYWSRRFFLRLFYDLFFVNEIRNVYKGIISRVIYVSVALFEFILGYKSTEDAEIYL